MQITQFIFIKVGKTRIMKDKTTKSTYTLAYSGNLQVPRIVEWIYLGSTERTRLKRKFETAIAMLTNLKATKVIARE